jgi:hypothetical protein
LKKKIQKKKREEKNKNLGWLGHPHGVKEVAETIPSGGLGVAEATTLAPWGWSSHPWYPEPPPLSHLAIPNFVFFFFLS